MSKTPLLDSVTPKVGMPPRVQRESIPIPFRAARGLSQKATGGISDSAHAPEQSTSTLQPPPTLGEILAAERRKAAGDSGTPIPSPASLQTAAISTGGPDLGPPSVSGTDFLRFESSSDESRHTSDTGKANSPYSDRRPPLVASYSAPTLSTPLKSKAASFSSRRTRKKVFFKGTLLVNKALNTQMDVQNAATMAKTFFPHHTRSLAGPEQKGEFSTLVQDHVNWILELPDLAEDRRRLYTSPVFYERWLNEMIVREEPDAPEVNLILPNGRKGRGYGGTASEAPPWELVYTNRIIYRDVSFGLG
jgi:hypothetical protein